MVEKTFDIATLAQLTGLSVRTVRYYIQTGVIDRPDGEKRGATYSTKHLEQLLAVQRLTAEGFSLSRIKEKLQKAEHPEKTASESPAPGTVTVKTHIAMAPGIELIVDSASSGLTGEALRNFARKASELAREAVQKSADANKGEE